jgi:putative addiction module killer protein
MAPRGKPPVRASSGPMPVGRHSRGDASGRSPSVVTRAAVGFMQFRLLFARSILAIKPVLVNGSMGTQHGNLCVTIMVNAREYLEPKGVSPFGLWFETLDSKAAAKVAIALTRLSAGNFSNTKGVGSSVFECWIDFGPGYRVYFGKDGESLVILLGGGTKKRQQNDIDNAVARWQDYKRRKKGEDHGAHS